MAIPDSKNEKLLGIKINNKLTFEHRLRSLWKKASRKLNTFVKITYSLKLEQERLKNAFVRSQFSYAPFAWMFPNQKPNYHIF